MTTLIPREPYTQDELARLYPAALKLQLVQVFLRHGERTPVSSRFSNTGLSPYWPYCGVARGMVQMASSSKDLSEWNGFQWRRKMESFGSNDQAMTATGPGGPVEAMCLHGELTDKGRETTYALGQRLRHLYVDQLGFMPQIKGDSEDMYLRATPIPRALESLQEAFWGMYPASARTLDFPPPVIVARQVNEETLFPNEGNCRRFRQLARLFADRAAARWNDSEQMVYLNSLWSKHMPEESPKVAVDAHPRLSGIMDTINATDAHGPATKLPSEFYDKKGRAVVDRIAVEEWFAGYGESSEYRKLGIGALMGDVVDRMVSTAVEGGWRSETAASGSGNPDTGKAIKFAMSGCHDTTLAAILSSVGGFQDQSWPPFTSSVAVELFSQAPRSDSNLGVVLEEFSNPSIAAKKPGVLSKLFGKSAPKQPTTSETARAPLESFSEGARESLQKHYVRIRYNDQPVRIPGCAAKPENHLPGDETFCTLDAFKEIVDKFTPKDWQVECTANLGAGLHGPDDREKAPAGF
ncbi:Histidine phosphatase superfamily clade-2 [Penicillium samsonianum]|uniref:Histidine phosphatase superfamily clade-2 n=1 Tax=Penicillium samsonianum TaxID=1882272 RepID=UPI002546BBB9|nr:Histidine phosphatase superfamily clade-2 [Penicillium samsonianum]KAJ6118145.1 Histidine phosphatase superfamily clade-2 [Penicillium samsonianum]